jgi:hypothetical protein
MPLEKKENDSAPPEHHHASRSRFVRIHQSRKVSPAMAAAMTDRLWDMNDLLKMIEAFEHRRAVKLVRFRTNNSSNRF